MQAELMLVKYAKNNITRQLKKPSYRQQLPPAFLYWHKEVDEDMDASSWASATLAAGLLPSAAGDQAVKHSL